MLIFDLTLPLSPQHPPFIDPNGYADPPTQVEPWVTIGEQRGAWTSPFHVTKLQLSAHAGTHVDAPSHFHAGAPSVSGLPAQALAGRAAVIDLRGASAAQLPQRLRRASDRTAAPGVTPLILTPPIWLTLDAVDEIIAWGRPLIAFAGETDSDESFAAVSRLLAAHRWIVTNLDPKKAAQVQDGDLLIVAPLAVEGLEGSPCRVFALRE